MYTRLLRLSVILLFLVSIKLLGQNLTQCDYLIISPTVFSNTNWELKLKEIFTNRGFNPHVEYVSNSSTSNSIKDLIAQAYNDGTDLKYVLLIGNGKSSYDQDVQDLLPNDPDYYTKNPLVDYLEGNPAVQNYIPFCYVESKNNWVITGKQNVASDEPYVSELAGRGEVSIGRVPAESAAEVWVYVQKLENYYLAYNNNTYEDYRSKELLLTMDVDCPNNYATAELATNIQNEFKQNHLPNGIILDEIKVSNPGEGDAVDPGSAVSEQNCPKLGYCEYRETKFENKINEGYGLISMISTHGGPIKLAGWYWADRSRFDFSNTQKLSYLFGLTCNMGEVNHPTYPSVVKKLMMNTDGGIIGSIAPTGATLQRMNGYIQNFLHDKILQEGMNKPGNLVRSLKEDLRSSQYSRFEFYTNSIIVLGDPSLPIMLEKKEIDNITGTDTWNGLVSINQDLVVEQNATLNIEAGTKIRIFNGAKLIVNGGTLNLQGTESNPVIIDFPDRTGNVDVNQGSNFTATNAIFENVNTPILIDRANNIHIANSTFKCDYGLYIYQNDLGSVTIENNQFNSTQAALYLVSCFAPVIRGNEIANSVNGMILSDVTKPYIIDNTIENCSYGIHYYSSGGFIVGNEVRNCQYGVYLYNSTAVMGENTITENSNHGLYILNGTADLRRLTLSIPSGVNQVYSVSGFNKIFNNAGVGDNNDGDEIFLNGSTISMYSGCNEVYDDRQPVQDVLETKMLIGGINFNTSTPIDCQLNYWGDNPWYGNLSDRFHNLITYSPEGCLVLGGPGAGATLSLNDAAGNEIMSFNSVGTNESELSPEMQSVKTAEDKYYSGNKTEANNSYREIVSTYPESDYSIIAASKINEIGLAKNDNVSFETNKQLFSEMSETSENEIHKFMYSQLKRKNMAYLGEYSQAISEYEQLIAENDGTPAAIGAQIDMLTTIYRAVSNGEIVQKSGQSYNLNNKDNLIKTMYELACTIEDASAIEDDTELILSDYVLKQNYPNPFNPSTTIEYAIPEKTMVELTVFNILGEEVSVLANSFHKAGNYQVSFNAGNLSSGLYIYRLKTNSKTIAKKMILVK